MATFNKLIEPLCNNIKGFRYQQQVEHAAGTVSRYEYLAYYDDPDMNAEKQAAKAKVLAEITQQQAQPFSWQI